MPTIQSIICFNGGAAGDFLKLACCVNLSAQLSVRSILNGRVEIDSEFKFFTVDVLRKEATWDDLESRRFSLVENSHYFFPELKNLTRNLFFIDYPDSVNKDIVEAYQRKRFPDREQFTKHVQNTFPPNMQKLVTNETVVNICNITWLRNLKDWRSNPDLTAVDLAGFFDLDSFLDIVSQITGQKITRYQDLKSIHSHWIKENQELVNLFTMPRDIELCHLTPG